VRFCQGKRVIPASCKNTKCAWQGWIESPGEPYLTFSYRNKDCISRDGDFAGLFQYANGRITLSTEKSVSFLVADITQVWINELPSTVEQALAHILPKTITKPQPKADRMMGNINVKISFAGGYLWGFHNQLAIKHGQMIFSQGRDSPIDLDSITQIETAEQYIPGWATSTFYLWKTKVIYQKSETMVKPTCEFHDCPYNNVGCVLQMEQTKAEQGCPYPCRMLRGRKNIWNRYPTSVLLQNLGVA
jgi:hypothetical protein